MLWLFKQYFNIYSGMFHYRLIKNVFLFFTINIKNNLQLKKQKLHQIKYLFLFFLNVVKLSGFKLYKKKRSEKTLFKGKTGKKNGMI